MGAVLRRLTEDDVVSHVHGICFKTGPPGLLGIESEWLVTDLNRTDQHVPLSRLTAAMRAAAPLPAASAVTYEPGGQLELSTSPRFGPFASYSALRADLAHVRTHLARAGLGISGWGVDPYRPPVRQLTHPRYCAMESFFDADGSTGRIMMCSTAALQVCVDVGADLVQATRRWHLAHALGPVLVAAFANSPLRAGAVTGWKSTRQAVWAALDHGRTRPPTGSDPVEAWTRYALDAKVMVVRRDDGEWLTDPGMTFREWLAETDNGRPTAEDLAYHLTTLFPPVRPRGWLELRMIDAQHGEDWIIPLAVVAALFDDAVAADLAFCAAEPVRDRWETAAREALADDGLAQAARTCFEVALAALPRLGAEELVPAVERYAERYVACGRCPADDALERVCEPTEVVPWI